MTDFEYEVAQRKKLTYGARHRKCGSKSKRCSLPSDTLTHKEWKERCGKVISYAMNEPISWETFKSMAPSSKKEYLGGLRDRYSVTAVQLGEMFGVTPLTVRRAASRIGIEFRKGQHMSRAEQDRWDGFISGEPWRAPMPPEDISDTPVADQSCAETPVVTDPCPSETPTENTEKQSEYPQKSGMKLSVFSMRFDGQIDVHMIANSLLHILGSDSVGTVKIHCELTDED